MFGFVRFKEVAYPMELERRLDQIWIGSYKMRENYTRFSRNMEGQRQGRVSSNNPAENHEKGTGQANGGYGGVVC